MKIKYVHTNIISENWRKLADFYIDVFDCKQVPPERDLSGEWLDKGTAVLQAHLTGMHLKLPGYNDNGTTLEIYQYEKSEEKSSPAANRKGFGHIAFLVDDVETMLNKAIKNGGKSLGEVVYHHVDGVGDLCFVYITDPEGNIIELQKWN